MYRYKLKNSLQFFKNFLTSDYRYTQKRYEKKFGYLPDLNHPQTYNEKLNALKLSDECYKLAPFVDKFEVRNHVAKVIGKLYAHRLQTPLNKLLIVDLP